MRGFPIVCFSFVVFSAGALLFGQIQAKSAVEQTVAKPEFEVASIRKSAPLSTLTTQIASGKIRPGMSVVGNRFDCHMTLISLIAAAYKVKVSQIVAPDWLNSKSFEIHATIPEGISKDQVPEMLQMLLKSRFTLKAHLEKKEQPVYSLVAAKEGQMLELSSEAEDASSKSNVGATPSGTDAAGRRGGKIVVLNTPDGQMSIKQEGKSTLFADPRSGPVRVSNGSNGAIRIEIQKMSMSAFAEWLTPLVGQPVIDATNLKGSYKMTMELPPEALLNTFNRSVPIGSAPGANPFRGPSGTVPNMNTDGKASDPSGGAVFHAVRKLGLDLNKGKAPIETLIIDDIQKEPTEN